MSIITNINIQTLIQHYVQLKGHEFLPYQNDNVAMLLLKIKYIKITSRIFNVYMNIILNISFNHQQCVPAEFDLVLIEIITLHH